MDGMGSSIMRYLVSLCGVVFLQNLQCMFRSRRPLIFLFLVVLCVTRPQTVHAILIMLSCDIKLR